MPSSASLTWNMLLSVENVASYSPFASDGADAGAAEDELALEAETELADAADSDACDAADELAWALA